MPDGSTTALTVELHGVSKSYREGETAKPILVQVDGSLPEGELVVLLGRSGSGKSTLLNLMAGLDVPDQGRVVVLGQDLSTASDRDRTLFRRRNLGFVFQFFNLIPTLSVLENVRLRLELNGKTGAVAEARAKAMLAEVGLSDRASAYPDRLSGGEQQRVAIAAAVVHEPNLILADEPTGNLDLETGRTVIRLLDRLSRAAGRTLVMATHSAEIAALADRIWTIEGGRLHESKNTRPA